ncbi:dihydrolipoamide acetyltransferase family protein [Moritella viscosa]|uniref:Dihydrolipoamide acetyltransferase component of pyruvate dehydrogenase complex n=1 Tax=Moritella viscosa TaxID=80854 RepID=A0ABY1HJK3_9GAMM|nr:dihydrolipoamide acetyltransferase family protein [Moritella viscosa]SGY89991.1 Pyruvate/2-oxoglutarate dehydrogenase complex dihydrolipoamideacyltransferase (E2) component [Moritella viscosa]SGY92624.1 Pyruvate/2-oxoglutarate dehydrogenase complex dihydrolipoamideacyltransferase (E2) component [Moritella viscosa]SGZ02517.1 Pyruvate/2-oxoglutarate dehydrogenase complex dihydrolipoamideacyltransferase (E2) component [Moritella viscosa]SHO25292.1 Pyruvate/2-oxoglutarate dehydrogenase complex d
MHIFKLPDLGEGLPEAEIVEWFIKPGDVVAADQLMVSMETAKAIVEIPCPESATVVKLYGQSGDIIHTGDPLVEFSEKGVTLASKAEDKIEQAKVSTSVVGELHTSETKLKETAQSVSGSSIGVKATPAVRALAHRYHIDLAIVTPSGAHCTITAADVERVVKIFADVGELVPLKGVRRSMAKAMTQAHAEVVPVTIHDDANITTWFTQGDITVRLIRAMALACEAEPTLNAWYDSHSIGRRIIKSMHLGLAVDTQDGLFVPVIRDAQNYSAEAMRDKINTIKELVSQRKIAADDLRGNTITLSNFGSMAGKYANPIVMPPTVAILGTGRLFQQLAYMKVGDGKRQVVERTLLPLSLTFDHRSITGGEAARFLAVLMTDLALDS